MTSLSGKRISVRVDTLGGSVLVGGLFSRSSSKSSIFSPNASIGVIALAPVVYLLHDLQRARNIDRNDPNTEVTLLSMYSDVTH